MIKINVTGMDAVQQKLKKLSSDMQQGKALQMAINKTAAKAKVEIGRRVRDDFLISADEVRNSIEVRPANRKNNVFEAVINIFGSKKRNGRSMNVSHFLEKSITMAQARKRSRKNMLYGIGKGGRLLPVLGFKFKRNGGVKHIEGAFIGNNGRTVFVRTGDKRLPIKPVQMIGVSQMFNTKRIHQAVINKINTDLVIEVERAVSLLLERAK